MHRYRLAGVVTGSLFIVATASGVCARVCLGALGPDFLPTTPTAYGSILVGGLMVMIMGWSGAGIGISLYPLLSPRHSGLALGASGFRIMEGIFHCLSGLCLFLLVASCKVPPEGVGDFLPWLALFLDRTRSVLVSGAGVISWCLGAALYYSLFLRLKLLPRWLSAWGLIGLLPMATASVLFLLGIIDDGAPTFLVLSLPIAVQEMVMAVYLIVRGFNRDALVD